MEILIEKSRKQRTCKARSADFYTYDSLPHSIADAAVFRSRRTTYTKFKYAYAAHQKPRNINFFSSRHAATTPLDTPPTPHATSLLHPYSLHPKNLKNHPIYSYTFNQLTVSYWPSRDPIGERGGVNLYGFVRNNGVNTFDYLGLESKDSNPCDDCKNAIEEAKKDPGYISLADQMKKKPCSLPSIECVRLKNTRIRGDYQDGKIRINCNCPEPDYLITIIHEMVHAYDDCYGRLAPHGAPVNELCSKKACTEIRAFYYANCRSINDPVERRKCAKNGAIGSVGENPSCTNAEAWVTDQMMDHCIGK